MTGFVDLAGRTVIRGRLMLRSAAVAAALAGAALVTFAAVPEAGAIPRFAVRNGAHCTLCHVSPNGGGARNDYGRDVFEKTRLGFRWLDLSERSMAGLGGDDIDGAPSAAEGKYRGFGISGALTEWLSVGADLRVAFLSVEAIGDDGSGNPLNASSAPGEGFFLMQADLYVAAQLGRYSTFYLDRGKAAYEAWALYMHPGRGYVRVGYFTPSYGLRLEEHRAYVAEDIGLGASIRETGAEAGLWLGPLQINLGLAVPFGPLGAGSRSASNWNGFGLYGTLTFARAWKDFSLVLGLSTAIRTRAGSATLLLASPVGPTPCGVQEVIAGVFGGASLGRFTYLTEVDLIDNRPWVAGIPPASAGTCGTGAMFVGDATYRGLVVYHELSFAVFQGFDVIGTWEFKDPDLRFASGAETRFGAGFEFFFTGNSQMKLMWRHRASRGDAFGTNGEDEVLVFVHLFF